MNNPKNDNKETKARLAKFLRMEEGTHRFEFVWNELERKGTIKEWELGSTTDEDVRVDAEEFRRLYSFARGERQYRSEQGEKQTQEDQRVQHIPVELAERERVATDALRKYLAAHAARRPLVQRFRREDLPHGRLLTRDEDITAFLAKELGVEPDLRKYLDSRRGYPADTVRFDMYAELPTRDQRAAEDENVVQTFYTHAEVADIVAEDEVRQERLIEEDWEGPPGWHLDMLGKWLQDVYPWESVGDAVVFLISGRPPRLAEPLYAAHNVGNGTYSITFWPWISEETVLRAYRTIQRQGQSKLPGDKTVRVLRFVSEQADQDGGLPSLEQMRIRWNAANPGEKFSDDTGRTGLWRAYARARKALLPRNLPPT